MHKKVDMARNGSSFPEWQFCNQVTQREIFMSYTSRKQKLLIHKNYLCTAFQSHGYKGYEGYRPFSHHPQLSKVRVTRVTRVTDLSLNTRKVCNPRNPCSQSQGYEGYRPFSHHHPQISKVRVTRVTDLFLTLT